MSTAKTG